MAAAVAAEVGLVAVAPRPAAVRTASRKLGGRDYSFAPIYYLYDTKNTISLF